MMNEVSPLSRVVAALPATTPFMPPEAIEREMGRPFELRLGANESAFGPSPKAVEAIERTLPRIWQYNDATNHALKSALAAHLGIGYEQVIVGPGIDGLLGHLARVFLNPGDRVVTSLGGYPTVEYATIGVGAVLEKVPYRNDAPDLHALSEKARNTGAKIVYLANPDNPSGAWYPPAEIREFVEAAPAGCAVILDEAYSEFAPEGSPAAEFLDDPRVVRLRTFSKVYGMAGMRVGYVFGDAHTIEPINRIRMHFEASILAQAAAIASLADEQHRRWVIEETAKGREDYAQIAGDLGFRALPSHTNFVCIDVGSHDRAVAMVEAFKRAGVFIRMPWAAPLNRCIRVSVGTEPERRLFAEIFRSAATATGPEKGANKPASQSNGC